MQVASINATSFAQGIKLCKEELLESNWVTKLHWKNCCYKQQNGTTRRRRLVELVL